MTNSDYSSGEKKHVFKVRNTITGQESEITGEFYHGHYSCDGGVFDGDVTYKFKGDGNNPFNIREITYDGTEYKITAMLRNRPIPEELLVLSHTIEEKYSEEEKRKRQLMFEIHTVLSRRLFGDEYLSYREPITIRLESIGKTVSVQFFTKDWFGCDDIINYRTDHVRMSYLSEADLEKVKSTLL